MAIDSKDTSMREVSMYMASTWKAIFDSINNSIGKDGTYFTFVSYDGKNFINESLGPDNRVDIRALSMNIGTIIECEPYMKDLLINEMNREKVSYAGLQMNKEIGDGKVRPRCYFAIDKRDMEKALSAMDRLNKIHEPTRVEPTRLLEMCNEKGCELSTIRHIENEVFDTMIASKPIDFPYSVIENRDRTYDIVIPETYKAKFEDMIKDTAILCSGDTRDAIIHKNEERNKEIITAISSLTDDKKPYIIIDAEHPENYMKTDMHGLHMYVRTGSGDKEIDFIERNDPVFFKKAYNSLYRYERIVTLLANEKDIDKKIDAIRKEAEKDKIRDIDIESKVEYYKRTFVEALRESMERGDDIEKGRLKDNDYSFGAAIDHAIINKQDTLAGDLKSDKDLNFRAIDGIVGETSIDLSDLNGDAFEHAFCENILGTNHYQDLDERRQAEEEIIHNTALKELAKEDREVKQAVINELTITRHEINLDEYRLDDISRADFDREIKVYERETNEIHVEQDIDRD